MEQLLTDHARIRMHQRGISTQLVDELLAYGHTEYDHRGGMIVYFDRKARAYSRRNTKAYLVLGGDGAILTVGHRYRRINRS